MKVIVLGSGTSQGVPVIGCECSVCQSLDFRDQRLRVSILIQVNNQNFVIDTGPDFRQQMLREKIKSIDGVLFTHQHKDHTAGMDDLRSFNFLQGTDIPIYAREAVMQQLKHEFAYIFVDKAHKYPGVLNVEENIIDNQPFTIKESLFTPIEVLHHKLPVFGFRVQDFTYITDVNYISDAELEKVKGTRYLILGALQQEKHISHFNLEEAIEVVEKIKPEKAFFTHISHRMGLHAEINKSLPSHIGLAYDGLTLSW